MRSVALSEAKDRLSEFVAAAEAGDEIVITRHGKPRAKLVAIDDPVERKLRAQASWDALAALRAEQQERGITATASEFKEWINEGRL